jgi:arylsulfatase A
LLLCPDSGGWSDPRSGSGEAAKLPLVELYDLHADPGDRKNLFAPHPEVTRGLIESLEKLVAEGRSTPGAPQPNARNRGKNRR